MKKIIALILTSIVAIAGVVVGVVMIATNSYKDYNVNFYSDENKTTLLYSAKVPNGGDVKYDYDSKGTPAKSSTDEFNYVFSGWTDGNENYAKDTALPKAQGDKNYWAVFVGNKRLYTISFVDENGTTSLQSGDVAYGTVPTYTAAAPTKEKYVFGGWTDGTKVYEAALPAVTKAATYKAVYNLNLTSNLSNDFKIELNSSTEEGKLYTFELTNDEEKPITQEFKFEVDGTELPIYINGSAQPAGYVPLKGKYKAYISSDFKVYLTEPELTYELHVGNDVFELTKGENNLWAKDISLAYGDVLKIYEYTHSALVNTTPSTDEDNVIDSTNRIYSAAEYRVVFNSETNVLYVKRLTPEVVKNVYLVGTFNAWTPSNSSKMEFASGAYSITKTLAKDVKLQIQINDTKYGYDKLVDKTGFTTDDNNNIIISTGGVYVIYFTEENNVMISIINETEVVMTIGQNNVPLTKATSADHDAVFTTSLALAKDDVLAFNVEVALATKPNDVNNVRLINNKITVLTDAANATVTVEFDVVSGQPQYKLWVDGYEDTYSLNDQKMSDASTEPGDGFVAQYKLGGLTLTEGQELAFALNGNALTIAEATGNSKIQDNKVLVLQAEDDATVYLKLYADGTCKVWVSGDVKDRYTVNNVELVLDEDNIDTSFTQYKVTVTVTAGEQLQFKLNNVAITVAADTTFGNNVDAELKVIDAAETTIYLKQNKQTNAFSVWAGGFDESYFIGEAKMSNANKELTPGQNVDKQFKLFKDLTTDEELVITFKGTALTFTEVTGNATLSDGKVIVTKAATNAAIYLKRTGTTYSLYVSETVDAYFMNNVEMDRTPDDEVHELFPELYAQYEITLGLTAGQELSFKLFDADLDVTLNSSYGNNAKVEDGKIIVINAGSPLTVYLQIKLVNEVKTYQVWVDGFKEAVENFNTFYVYVDPTWNTDSPVLKVYAWGADDGRKAEFLDLTPVEGVDNLYTVKVYKNHDKLIVCRIKPDYEGDYNWDNKTAWLWNQTDDQELDGLNDLVVTGKLGTAASYTKYQEYTITFTDGETPYDTLTITSYPFRHIEIPTNPTDEHFDFSKWVYKDNLQAEFVFNENTLMPCENVVLVSLWDAKQWDLRLHLNGGTLDETPAQGETADGINTRKYTYQITFNLPYATKSGFNFLGWNTQANGGGDTIIVFEAQGGDVDLYAMWTVDFVVTFTSQRSADGIPQNAAVTPNTTFEIPTAIPTTEGYTFKGWNTEADGTGTMYLASTEQDKVTIENISDNLILYAQWEINKYEIKFFDEDGTTEKYSAEFEHGIVPLYKGETLSKMVGSFKYDLYGWKDTNNNIYKLGTNLPEAEDNASYTAVYDEIKVLLGETEKVLVEEATTGTSGTDKHQYKLTLTRDSENVLTFMNVETELTIYVGGEAKENYHPITGTYVVYVAVDYKVYLVEPEPEYSLGEAKMTKSTENVPAGYTQYEITTNLAAGATLAFVNQDNEAITVAADTAFGNNIDAELKVIDTAENAKVYLKRNNETGEFSLWVAGYVEEYFVGEAKMETANAEKPQDVDRQFKLYKDLEKDEEISITLKGVEITITAVEGNATLTDGKVVVKADALYALIYLKVYKANDGALTYKVYVSEANDKYYFNNQLMTKSTENIPAGVYAQYELEVDLTAGEQLAFKLFENPLTVVPETGSFGNNVNADLKAIDAATKTTVYLKVYKDGSEYSYKTWVGGFVEEYYIGDVKMKDATDELSPDQGVDKQFELSKDLAANDEIVITLKGQTITISSVSGNVTLAEGKVKVTKDAKNASIYLKRTGTTYSLYVSETVDRYFFGETEMSRSTENVPLGIAAQYELTVTVTAGDEVVFKLFDDAINVTIEETYDNNLAIVNNKLVVRNNATDVKVYLKKFVNGTDVTYKAILKGYELVDEDYKTFYVQVDSSWLADNATIEGYASTSTDGKPADWIELTAVAGSSSLYTAKIYKNLTKFIVCRIKPNPENLHDWDHKNDWLWTQTIDVELSDDNDLIMTGKLVAGTTTTTKYKDYTITIMDGETELTELKITAKPFALITEPVPTKDHYVLSKWVYADNHDYEFVFGDTPAMVAADITIVVVWAGEKSDLVLHLLGGTLTIDNTPITEDYETKYEYGKALLIPTSIEKEGYNFAGWFTQNGTDSGNWGEQFTSISETMFGEINLYAKWTQGYVVTYHQNLEGEDVTGVPTETAIANSQGKITLVAAPTTLGYTFVKWNTQADGNGTAYDAAEEITLTDSTDLYAIWTIKKFTINFYDEDGTTLKQTKEVEYKAIPTYTGDVLTKEVGGYSYALYGWTDATKTYTNELPQAVEAKDYAAIYDSITASVGTVAKSLTEVAKTGSGNDRHQYELTLTVDKVNTLTFKNNDTVLPIYIVGGDGKPVEEYHPLNGKYTVYITDDYKAYLGEPEALYAFSVGNIYNPISLPKNMDTSAKEWYKDSTPLVKDDVLHFYNTTSDTELEINTYSGALETATVLLSGNYEIFLKLEDGKYNVFTAKLQSVDVTSANFLGQVLNNWTGGAMALQPNGTYKTSNVLISRNDQVLVRINGDETLNFRYNSLTQASKETGLFEKGDHDNDHNDDNVRIKVGGHYDVVFNPTDCSLTITKLDTYTIKVGTGEIQNITELYMTDYPVSEGDAQYRIQITGNLGDELLFNVEGVTPNNNSNAKLVGETPKILLLSSVTNEYAYLKININGNDITYSLWVGGYHDMYFANNTELTLQNNKYTGTLTSVTKDDVIHFYTNTNGAKAELDDVTPDTTYGNNLKTGNVVANDATDVTVELTIGNTTKTSYLGGYETPESEYNTYYAHFSDDFLTGGIVKVFGFASTHTAASRPDEFISVTAVANSSNLYSFKLHNSYDKLCIIKTKTDYEGEWNTSIWQPQSTKDTWFIIQTVDITVEANKDLFLVSTLDDLTNGNVKVTSSSYTDQTLRFMDGETELTTQAIEAKPFSNVVLPVVVKAHYTFNGWLDSNNKVAKTYMPADGDTLHTSWTADQFDVTLNLNYDGAPASVVIKVTYDSKYTGLTTPERTGYQFSGWFTDETGGNQVTTDTTVTITAAQTLYAHWTINTYTVTFASNNNDLGTVVPSTGTLEVTVDYGTVIHIDANDVITLGDAVVTYTPTKHADGDDYTYAFTSWSVSNGDIITSALTITATFTRTPVVYSLVLHLNDGELQDTEGTTTDGVNTRSYTYGVGATLPAITRENWNFVGWYDAATDGNAVTNVSNTATGNKEFWARWTQNIPVTFNANAGTDVVTDMPGNASVESGHDYDIPATLPQRTGYTFAGWATTTDGAVAYAASAKIENITSAVALFAKWTINKYTVTWKNYDGTTLETDENVEYNTMPSYDGATPLRAQTVDTVFTFNTWSPAVAVVTADAVYTATFTETTRQYTVTFVDENGTTILKAATEYDYGTLAESIVKPANPTKAADAQYTYAFNGWDPAIANVTADATYRATYSSTVNKYSVTFKDYNETVLLAAAQYDYGTEAADITKPADPSRANTNYVNYAFVGWNSDKTATEASVVDVTEDVTYYAIYSVTKKYVMILGDNTLVEGEEVEKGGYQHQWLFKHDVTGNQQIHFHYGDDHITIENPSGNTDGIKILFDEENAYIYLKLTNDNKYELYVSETWEILGTNNNWAAGTYMHHNDDGTYSIVATFPELTNEQNRFKIRIPGDGWNNPSYPASDYIVNSGAAGVYVITATFSWTGNVRNCEITCALQQYKIKFLNEDSSVFKAEASYNWGTTDYDLSADPTKAGFRFVGWNDGENTYLTADLPAATANKTYTATFIQLFILTINVNEEGYGTVSAASIPNIPYDSIITISGNTIRVVDNTYAFDSNVITATPTDDTPTYDYEFTGWSGLTNLDHITSSTTIIANFTRTTKSYTVTYAYENVPEGAAELPAAASYEVGTEVTVAATPSKTGYVFEGWATTDVNVANGKFNMPTNAVTLVGTWKVDLTREDITIADMADQTYSASAITPTLTVTFGSTALVKDVDYTVSAENNTNVGTATITIAGIGNYTNAKSKTFEIVKAGLTITAKDHRITYGDAPTNNGVTYSGFVGNENSNILGGSLSYEYTYSQYGDVGGTYKITPKGYTSSNYEISFVEGRLDVDRKEIGITWSTPSTFTYDGQSHTLTATATGMVNNDVIGINVTGSGTTAGNHTITAASLTGGKAGNYKLPEANTTTLTIEKCTTNTITGAIDQTVSWTGNELSYSLTNVSATFGTPVLTNGSATNAGTITVTISVEDTDDYNGVEITKSFTINATLSYNANNATSGNIPESQVMVSGNTATNSGSLAKTGYTFAGWNTEADGTGTSYATEAAITLTSNLRLYAKWTAKTYTVNLSAPDADNKETCTKSVTATYDQPMPEIAVLPTRSGYAFGGYQYNSANYYDGVGNSVTNYQNDGDMTLTAVWIEKYAITFNDNYEGGASKIAYYDKTTPETLSTYAPTATRTGYIFTCWFTTSDNSGEEVILSSNVTSDNTYYAHWTPITFSVSFNGNGSTSGSMTNQEFTYDDAQSLTANTFEKTGYHFIGWSTTDIGTIAYTNEQSVSNLSSTNEAIVTLYAKWEINVYTITWYDGDNQVLDTDSVQHGDTPSYTGETTPTKTATAQYTYTFDNGWATTLDGAKLVEIPAATEAASYYAVFSSSINTYTITWKNYDDTVLETDNNVAYGETPTYNGETPTKASTTANDYSFNGWSPAVSNVTGAQTYTATFAETLRKYTVEFTLDANETGFGDVTASSGNLSLSLDYGTTIAVSSNVITINEITYTATETTDNAQYDYEFTGWKIGENTLSSNTTVSGAITITAHFSRTIKQYTITYYYPKSATGGLEDNSSTYWNNDTVNLEYGSNLTAIKNANPVVTPAGYVLASDLYTAYDYSSSLTNGFSITGNLSVYLKYTASHALRYVNGDNTYVKVSDTAEEVTITQQYVYYGTHIYGWNSLVEGQETTNRYDLTTGSGIYRISYSNSNWTIERKIHIKVKPDGWGNRTYLWIHTGSGTGKYSTRYDGSWGEYIFVDYSYTNFNLVKINPDAGDLTGTTSWSNYTWNQTVDISLLNGAGPTSSNSYSDECCYIFVYNDMIDGKYKYDWGTSNWS